MKSMNKDYIEKNDVANRYLHGRLMPEEQEAFENVLMESPDLLEELELNALFIKAMPQLNTPSNRKSNFNLFSLFGNKWLQSGAAGFILGVLTVLFFLPAEQSPFGTESTFDVFYAEHSIVRGSSVVPADELSHFTFSFNTMPDIAVLVLQEQVAFKQSYSVGIQNAANEDFAIEKHHITSTNDGELIVPLNKNKVKPGKYRIIYEEHDSDIQAQIMFLTINE